MTAPPSPVRLLDTDIIIDIQRKHAPAQEWLFTFAPGSVGIPGLVAMELIQSSQSAAQARAADKIIAPLPIIWPNEVIVTMLSWNFGGCTSPIAWADRRSDCGNGCRPWGDALHV